MPAFRLKSYAGTLTLNKALWFSKNSINMVFLHWIIVPKLKIYIVNSQCSIMKNLEPTKGHVWLWTDSVTSQYSWSLIASLFELKPSNDDTMGLAKKSEVQGK